MRGPELEKQIIGALFSAEDPMKLLQAAGLTAEDFEDSHLRICWEVAGGLVQRGGRPDAVTLWSACKTARLMAEDDLSWLLSLQAQSVVTLQGAIAMAKDLRRQSRSKVIANKLRALAQSVTSRNQPESALAEFCELQQEFTRLHTEGRSGSAAVIAAFEQWERRKASGRPAFVNTGLKVLDDHTGGLPPKLAVFLGEPGIGKSAIMAAILASQLRAGMKVLLFSLEDGDEWLVKRHLAQMLGMKARDVFAKEFPDPERAAAAAQELTSLFEGLRVVTRQQARTAADIARLASQYVSQFGCNAVFVDNMTCVKPDQGKFEDRRNAVGRGYEMLAEWADVNRTPVVALAHTTRDYQKRTSGRSAPAMSDIAESADADRFTRFVLSLWRGAGAVRATVVKCTEGEANVTFEFAMHHDAGLVDAESGRRIDVASEERAAARDRKARQDEESVARSAARRDLAAKLRASKIVPPTPPSPAAPQADLPLEGA